MSDSNNINYGPLAALIGTWKGDSGTDVAPEPDGKESTPYYETITIDAAGDVTNAEKQTLAVLRYHQVVSKKVNDEVFHDQIGYWTWDSATGVISQSLTIPRSVCVLAGGSATENTDSVEIKVSAKAGDTDWGIIQSPFMRDNAKTVAFEHKVTISGNTMTYSETTSLDIYGKPFEHTDGNTLERV